MAGQCENGHWIYPASLCVPENVSGTLGPNGNLVAAAGRLIVAHRAESDVSFIVFWVDVSRLTGPLMSLTPTFAKVSKG